jgi:hypothetical protein
LAPKEYEARLFSLKSTFEGQIDPQRLVIGYRAQWFVPPLLLATFSGRIRETDAGTKIHGSITSGWVIYLLAGWLVIFTPIAFFARYAADGDYFLGILALAIPFGLFFLGRAFVRTTHSYVASEIGRAVRGKVTQD